MSDYFQSLKDEMQQMEHHQQHNSQKNKGQTQVSTYKKHKNTLKTLQRYKINCNS
mgnify:CR=1 FL=1